MGVIEQPSPFFAGGFRIEGNVSLGGQLLSDKVQYGRDVDATGLNLALGIETESKGSQDQTSAIGNFAKALSQNATAIGASAQGLGIDATAIGAEAKAPSNWNTAIGYNAGSINNGENVVLIGRKAKGQGDNVVSIGENARADGNLTVSIGKASGALADNVSVFGHNSTAKSGSKNSTLVGQGLTVDNQDTTVIGTGITASAKGATAIGRNSVVNDENGVSIGIDAKSSGDGSIAIGKNAQVTSSNSVVIGEDSVIDKSGVFSFGNRDLALPTDRSFIYPTDPGPQTLVDMPVTTDSSSGDTQEYTFNIGGESIFAVSAEADGSGGIQNKVARIRGSFDLRGGSDDLADIVSGDMSVVDSDGDEQIGLDATSDPVNIDLHNNRVRNFGLRTGESITYKSDAGSQTLADVTVDSASVDTEQSLDISIDGNSVVKAYAESDGAGGIQNAQLRLGNKLNLNQFDIVDSSSSQTVWDSDNQHIDLSALEEDTLTVTGGDGLKNGGDVTLGNSLSLDIEPSDFVGTFLSSDVDDNINVNIGNGLQTNGSDAIEFDESIQYSFSDDIEFQTSISVSDFQDIQPRTNEPSAPTGSTARIFVQDTSPPEVKVKDSQGDTTTLITLSD